MRADAVPTTQGDFGGQDLLAQRMDMSLARADEREAQGDASALGARGGPSAGGVAPADLARLRKVSQDFESLFLSYMMKVGREASFKSEGFFARGEGEKIFTDMRDDELAKHMAKAGGIGLADLIVEQLSRTLRDQAREQAALQAARKS